MGEEEAEEWQAPRPESSSLGAAEAGLAGSSRGDWLVQGSSASTWERGALRGSSLEPGRPKPPPPPAGRALEKRERNDGEDSCSTRFSRPRRPHAGSLGLRDALPHELRAGLGPRRLPRSLRPSERAGERRGVEERGCGRDSSRTAPQTAAPAIHQSFLPRFRRQGARYPPGYGPGPQGAPPGPAGSEECLQHRGSTGNKGSPRWSSDLRATSRDVLLHFEG